MPSLSVRSFSELLSKPAIDQMRILSEQKYPSKEPQVFKIPFYNNSLIAIKNFYRMKNDSQIISEALRNIEMSVRHDAKRIHNRRVLNSFVGSAQAGRKLKVQPTKKYSLCIGEVELRLCFDLSFIESKEERLLYYNFRNAAIDQELARKTLEISHFLLNELGNRTELKNLEYVDLFNHKNYNFSKIRKSTIALMKENIKVIEALWPVI